MTIIKLEAVRRQLDAAIRLYFAEDDPIAVHTLVGAPHILITDLRKAAKLESILDRYIVPDYRWKFEGAIRSAQNPVRRAEGRAAAADYGADTRPSEARDGGGGGSRTRT